MVVPAPVTPFWNLTLPEVKFSVPSLIISVVPLLVNAVVAISTVPPLAFLTAASEKFLTSFTLFKPKG